jgi:hypothetical protein
VLGLSSRLVFSTPRNAATAPRYVTLTNPSSTAVVVGGLRFGGMHPGQFRLASGQPTRFTIGSHGSRRVGVRFRPTSTGNKFAVLTITNTSARPSIGVKLRGVRTRGTVRSAEPQLGQLMQLFGYTTRVGFTRGQQATTRSKEGDEVGAPYFVRVDGSRPVRLVPIARFTAPVGKQVDSGRTPYASRTRNALYWFRDAENDRRGGHENVGQELRLPGPGDAADQRAARLMSRSGLREQSCSRLPA